ncbi:hypothetical protein FHL15_003186 [Xylaria flabelliformis]|uniref:Cytochrome P450 monooxygenase n=1 Tax=Xylaria flabelliformis TaxID=2512241 RepID=A0A553I784_9PEZI|nr:hypothetical protein FHL15_003186 [Xylaria flabelliformis]
MQAASLQLLARFKDAPDWVTGIAIALAIVPLSLLYLRGSMRLYKDFPMMALVEDGLDPKESWFQKGPKTIQEGLRRYRGRPFQVMTGTGPKLVLPHRFAEELKTNENLSHNGAFAKDFFVGYPGFGPIADSLIPELIRTKITPALGLITDDLVDETTAAIQDILGENTEWHEVSIKQDVLKLVTRLSSRLSLGLPKCRDDRWLEITKDYTVHLFASARELRQVPSLLRPFVHWFLPESTRLRRDYQDAQTFITPEVELRKVRARKALEAGEKASKTADVIGWMYELATEKGQKVNYVDGLLEIGLASIHTSTEAITSALLSIVAHPEILQPLRDEVISIIGSEGWSRQTLYKMRLMDSFLKENQRCHPPNAISMNRLVTKDIKLSDGSLLKPGTRFIIPNVYTDPEIYANPEEFDPYRFLRKREKPGQTNSWQHVSLSSSHMAFGYGNHACPGRFFASTEIKIAIAYLLLKYDWIPTTGDEQPGTLVFETNTLVRPTAKLMVKRRKEEVALDCYGARQGFEHI